MKLQKATRKKVKLRLGLSAVSGGGKTYSALLLAHGLVGDWSKIAVIDTENGSASLYSHLGEFLTAQLRPPFSPERYIEYIKGCEDAGVECIIIDSIAHEWEGEGGVLDLCDKLGGGFQNGWKAMTPRHNKFIQSILQSSCHVITTVRRKTEYSMQETTNRQGKTVQAPVKVGLKEITREGFEYEVTVNLELDIKHYATSSKDRTGLFADKDPFIITSETGRLIKEWCETGVDEINEYINKLENCITVEELKMFKSILPEHLSKNEEFKKAAIERYNQIHKTEQKEYLYKKNTNGVLTKNWEDVIHNIANNDYTLEKIKEQFKLTKEMEEEVKFQISILNHIDDFNVDDDKKQLNKNIELTHI